MKDLNCVVIAGRLTKDAAIQSVGAGAVLRFSLAVNRSVKKGDQWTDEAGFFDVDYWTKAAQALQPRMAKGTKVTVQGELRQERWEKNGESKSRLVIVAHDVYLDKPTARADDDIQY